MGIINRGGFGKTRHIDIGHLWIQETVAKEKLKFKKILGKDNPADLYTKYLDEKTGGHHVKNFSFKLQDGRAQEAPQLHNLEEPSEWYSAKEDGMNCGWVDAILEAIDTAKGKRDRAYSAKHVNKQKVEGQP